VNGISTRPLDQTLNACRDASLALKANASLNKRPNAENSRPRPDMQAFSAASNRVFVFQEAMKPAWEPSGSLDRIGSTKSRRTSDQLPAADYTGPTAYQTHRGSDA
jgi:hypothetical protein